MLSIVLLNKPSFHDLLNDLKDKNSLHLVFTYVFKSNITTVYFMIVVYAVNSNNKSYILKES